MARRRRDVMAELAARFDDGPPRRPAPAELARRPRAIEGSHAAAERAVDAAEWPGRWEAAQFADLPEADRLVAEALARGNDREAKRLLPRVHHARRRDRRKVRRPRLRVAYLAGRR